MTEEFQVTLNNGDVRTLIYRLGESEVPDGWYLSHGTIQYKIDPEATKINAISTEDQERLQALPNRLAVATDLERFVVPTVTETGKVVVSTSINANRLKNEVDTLLHTVLGGA